MNFCTYWVPMDLDYMHAFWQWIYLHLWNIYLCVSRESEYAAWTLVNGFALNHATISTHRLKSHMKNINSLNNFIERNGFKLNSEGGALKGLLLHYKFPPKETILFLTLD